MIGDLRRDLCQASVLRLRIFLADFFVFFVHFVVKVLDFFVVIRVLRGESDFIDFCESRS